MSTLKQIAFQFESVQPAAPEMPLVVKEATTPEKKKRGRKPKPKPLVPPPPAKRGRISFSEADIIADVIDVPPDDLLHQKQYYSISQVAAMFKANISLIRMWSKNFAPFLQTRTNKKGDRFFRPEDVKTLQLIHHLVRQRKFTVAGAKDFLKKNKNARERFEMIQSLEMVKGFLLEVKASL